MRGTVSKYVIRLKSKQRRRLEAVVRRRRPSHWLVMRSKIVLMSAEGQGVAEVAAALSLDRQVVRRWRKRFVEGGIDALGDRQRPGSPPRISTRAWRKAATLVVQSPTKFGLPFARWSMRDLALICKLYLSPPPRTVLLSLDEKPGVQAISRRFPTRPARRGQVAKVEFEYPPG